MQPLPIDDVIPRIIDALGAAPAVVVEAPPGAGKTTRVPRAILEHGVAGGRDVIVLQPRRLPTRLAARRVAVEIGEPVGGTVGYTVRFEDLSGPRTRLRYVTEGILTRMLVDDPLLARAGAVVLDEFHERHIATDLALALLKRLKAGRRPDLKIVVMSATLDAGPVAAYLGGAPRVRSEGRRFDVAIEHLARPDHRPLHVSAAAACRDLLRRPGGDVLVFLPGAAEIGRTFEEIGPFATEGGFLVTPLHGNMTLDAQHHAVTPAGRRKVILSTNVAETSVTIEGVTAVVDSGLARVAGHSPWNGLPTLEIAKISRASAIQRAGRAGRTGPGAAIRLFTAQEFAARPEHDVPEIRRGDLAETLLWLHASGADPGSFEWLDPPPPAAIDAAASLLRRLGALDAGGITETGRRIAGLPVHPRLARLIVEGERRGVAPRACAVAAICAERDIRLETRTGGRRGSMPARGGGDSDLIDMFELLDEAAGDENKARRLGLDARAVETADRARRQLERLCAKKTGRPIEKDEQEKALLISVLTAFPDRVAKRRERGRREVVLSEGGSAEISEQSVVHHADLMVAVDAEDRSGRGRRATVVRLASAIEPEWLLDLFPDHVADTSDVVWNAAAERVEAVSRLAYDHIAIAESRGPAPASEEVSGILAAEALKKGIAHFDPDGALPSLSARIALLSERMPETGFVPLDDEGMRGVLAAACRGLKSFAEIRRGRLDDLVIAGLSPDRQRALRTHAPTRIDLPGGRSVAVHYEADKAPWVESQLQDFFGMARSPSVCAGRVTVVAHLLAPSRRPVQVTADLSGFWKNHYPAIRRELGRRYPKHAWPEDGAAATPPAPRRRKK